MINREQIYSELFAVLKTAVNGQEFRTFSRRFRNFTEVGDEEMGYLCLQQWEENSMVTTGTRAPSPPNSWELLCQVVIYVYAGPEPDANSIILLNNAVDAIERVCPSDSHRRQNLGLPNVVEARVSGKVEYGEGHKTGLGIATVPIRILAV